MKYKNCGAISAPRKAPVMAPTVVAISRNMPTLKLVIRSRRYATAEPLDVAMTEIMLAPIA
ncbi:hypothetical protein D1872_270690 [compost metagenome]